MRAIANRLVGRLQSRRPPRVSRAISPASGPVDRNVFVVYGRDEALRRAVFDFLRAIDLRPLEWEELVRNSGHTAPFLGDVAAQAARQAQAALVILSPDDVVRLHPQLYLEREDLWEFEATCQPRPNVLIELGMVLMAYPQRTVILEAGDLRPIADLAGRNTIRLNGSTTCLGKIIERLKSAGCAVADIGEDWRDTRPFANLGAYRRRPFEPARPTQASP